MKAVDLGKAAAAAEGLRLQKVALRLAVRIAFLVVAALFGLFALISLHVLLWVLCYGPWHTGKVWASVIVLGFDVVCAGILLILGRSRSPGAAEIAARLDRDRNLAAMRSALALSAVTAGVTGPAGRLAGRGLLGASRALFRRALPRRSTGRRSRAR